MSEFEVKKRTRYEEKHKRRTYYIEKENIKMIDKIRAKTNQDNSYIVNQALRYFFENVKF